MQVALALCHGLVEPEVIGRDVEFAQTTRNLRPVLDSDEPFVVAQMLTQLATQGMQQSECLRNFIKRRIKRFGRDVRIVTEGR